MPRWVLTGGIAPDALALPDPGYAAPDGSDGAGAGGKGGGGRGSGGRGGRPPGAPRAGAGAVPGAYAPAVIAHDAGDDGEAEAATAGLVADARAAGVSLAELDAFLGRVLAAVVARLRQDGAASAETLGTRRLFARLRHRLLVDADR